MAIQRKNYDPAIMYGADQNMTVDLGDVRDANDNEILEFDAVASAVNYVRLANAATGNAPVISAQGDDTNIPLTVNSLLTGALTLDSTSTGAVNLGTGSFAKTVTVGNTTGATAVAIKSGTGGTIVTSADADALTVGANGATNPVVKIDASTASVATGVSVTGAAAAGGVAVAAISSGTNEDLTVDAKGSGTVTLNGTATGNIVLGATTTGAVGITSSSATAGIGYATGAGGAVTQVTSRSTGVTLSKVTGAITTDTTSLAAGAAATFTVTNTAVAIGDVIVLSVRSGATTVQTNVRVSAVAAGSFDITVENNHASTAETGAIVINFAVIKAVGA